MDQQCQAINHNVGVPTKVEIYNMRIRFKIKRSTGIETSSLIKKIIAELNKSGYKIITQTENCVALKDNAWRIASRTEVYKKVDGGTFYIDTDGKMIVFEYYLSMVYEIVLIAVFAIFGLLVDHLVLFFIPVMLFFLFIKIISVRSAANDMLDTISSAPDLQSQHSQAMLLH